MSEAEITKPNPADFKVDLRPKEFVARFRIVAEVTETIEADDIDAALAKAKAMTETSNLLLIHKTSKKLTISRSENLSPCTSSRAMAKR